MGLKRARSLRIVVALAAAAVVSLCAAAGAGAKLYYMSITFNQNAIAVANSTGQTTNSDFIPTGRIIGGCCTHIAGGWGLATDGPHMYWTNNDGDEGTESSLGTATLDDNGEPIESSIDQTAVMLPGKAYGLAAAIQPDGTTYLYWASGPVGGVFGPVNNAIGQMHMDADGNLIPGSMNPNFITGLNDLTHVATNSVTTGDGTFTDIYWNNKATDSIGHARVDSAGALVGTPNPLAVPPNFDPEDPGDGPDVYGPSGVTARDGYLYWADTDEWDPDVYQQRADGHQVGRVALGEDGLPSGPVEPRFIDGVGTYNDAFTGTQTPSGMSTDGSFLYWANFNIPFYSDKVDDIGRAPLVDPNGPGFQFSFVRTGYVSEVEAMRDASVTPSCPTSKEPVVHCTITVKDPVATGAHAPIGHVTMSSRSAGGVWDPGAECLLSVVGPDTSTCSVDYDRAGTNGELITGSYAGDTLHSASSGTGNLLPVPVDPPDDGNLDLPNPPGGGTNPGNQNQGNNGGAGSGSGSKSKHCKKKKKSKKKKCKKHKKGKKK